MESTMPGEDHYILQPFFDGKMDKIACVYVQFSHGKLNVNGHLRL